LRLLGFDHIHALQLSRRLTTRWTRNQHRYFFHGADNFDSILGIQFFDHSLNAGSVSKIVFLRQALEVLRRLRHWPHALADSRVQFSSFVMRICVHEVAHTFPEIVAAAASSPTRHNLGGLGLPASVTPLYLEKDKAILVIVSSGCVSVYR